MAVSTTEVTIPGFVTQLPIVQTAPSPVRAAIPRISRAEGAEHHTEREVHGLQHRPLLDVQLEVGGRALQLRMRVEGAVEVDAMGGERVLPADAVGVDALPDLGLVGHRPRGCTRPEEGATEARALLVGPADEPDRERRRAVSSDPPQDLDPGDDVERSVEPAAVGHRVDVPSDDERALGLAPKGEPLVAGLVDLLFGAGGGELAREPALGRDPGVRPGDPLSAVRVSGQLAQLAKLVDGAAWFERHGGNV